MKLPALIVLVIVFPICINAQNKVKVEPSPRWVTNNVVNFQNSKLDDKAEDGYVDLVYENQIHLKEQSIYYKKVIKILSEAGIQNSSEVSINYDPSYEQLIFHSVLIIRGNNKINKLDLKKIKTIQQEKDLDRFIYDGSKTSILILEDVRKGDIIEYSYSVKGANPILAGKFSVMLETMFSVPVYQLYYKLITPKNFPISIKSNQTNLSPVVTKSNFETSYEWTDNNVMSLYVPGSIPSWYDPYPTIMISEYKSWKEVNDWARSLFTFDLPLSKDLQSKIDEIRKANKTQEKALLAALRFVQDEIRYLGIEMGENSHKPNSPDKTLKQRFGDCKDKSYLLCTLLKALNIEASPVLLNTVYKKTIGSWLPTATAFDHVAVRVRVNGLYYWFDPTISYQRGTLESISFPDYQLGLVVDDGTTELTAIPFKNKGDVNVKEVFNVADMSGSVSLVVTSNYTGSYADNIREDFKNNSINEKQKDYLDYYAAYIDKIKADSLKYVSNEESGDFTTIEYYTLSDFWGKMNSIKNVSFEPYVINGVIKKLKDENRVMPFSLPFPAIYNEEIEILLPDNWNIQQFSEDVSCSNFKLSYSYNCSGRKVSLKYHYENLKDHVLPEEFKSFEESLIKADKSLGYSLTSSFVSETGLISSNDNNYSYLYLILGICVFVTIMVRKNKGR